MFTDSPKAKRYLKNISYFRLSAYTRPFYIPSNTDDHRFISGTTFDDVLKLYIFDRELRLLLLDAIERIEVSLRAQMTQVLATHHGPHGYLLAAALFDSRYRHDWLADELKQKSEQREVETFLNSYRRKYPRSPVQPPLWMALELLSFGQISNYFLIYVYLMTNNKLPVILAFPLLCSNHGFVLYQTCATTARIIPESGTGSLGLSPSGHENHPKTGFMFQKALRFLHPLSKPSTLGGGSITR